MDGHSAGEGLSGLDGDGVGLAEMTAEMNAEYVVGLLEEVSQDAAIAQKIGWTGTGQIRAGGDLFEEMGVAQGLRTGPVPTSEVDSEGKKVDAEMGSLLGRQIAGGIGEHDGGHKGA